LTAPERLAIRRERDKTFTLLGSVESADRDQVTFTTPSGTTESVTRRDIIFVEVGSLNHFARLDPERLSEAFRAAPLAVFEQALIDASGELSGAQLRAKLVQAGLDSDLVETRWSELRTSLESGAGVKTVRSGSTTKYSWKGDRAPRLREFVPPAHSQAPATATEPEPKPDSKQIATAPQDTVAKAPSTEPEVKGDSSLAGLLRQIMGKDAPRQHSELSDSVLRVANSLRDVPEDSLTVLATVPSEERELVRILLALRPKKSDLWPDAPAQLEPWMVSAALTSAVGEASRERRDAASFASFATRLVRRTDLSAIPLHLIAHVFVVAAGSTGAQTPAKPVLDLAGFLADRISTSTDSEWSEMNSLLPRVGRELSRLPLDADGPRSRCLAAVFVVRRDLLLGELLWRGIDFDALDEATVGVLRRCLMDPDIADFVVKPRVQDFVAHCSTRHGLGRVVGMRGQFAKYVSAESIAEAVRRVASNDANVSGWLNLLQQKHVVDAALRARDEAVASVTESTAERADLERRLVMLQEQIAATKADLLRASAANKSVDEAHLRQAKLDVLRTLATLALTIKSSATASADATLSQRVDFALSREGLEPIAAAGASASYDPAVHDALGRHIDPGEPVSVGRAGYTYTDADIRLVLIKAQVSAVQE
jgi:hypothetical protein